MSAKQKEAVIQRRALLRGLLQSWVVFSFVPSVQGMEKYAGVGAPIPIVNNLPPWTDLEKLGIECLKLIRLDGVMTLRIYLSSCEPVDQSNLHEYVSALVKEDYDRGETVRVDGWIYSQTELQLCLLHVTESRQASWSKVDAR